MKTALQAACLTWIAVWMMPSMSRAAEVISLDRVIDWRSPVGMTREAFEKSLPQPLDEERREKSSQGETVLHVVSSEDTQKYSILDGKFGVDRFIAVVDPGDGVWLMNLVVDASEDKVLPALKAVLPGSPETIKDDEVTPGYRTASHTWISEKYFIRTHATPSGRMLVAMALTSKLVANADPSMPPLFVSADLDLLLNAAKFWQCDAASFERQYRPKVEGQEEPPQFEWLSPDKSRARFSRKMYSDLETKLTMFGGSIRVEEAVVEFVGGKAARATISFYNRGDSGEIDPARFEAIYKKIGQNLGQVFKVPPKRQLNSSNAAVKTVGWVWTSPLSVAILEYNEPSQGSKPEFLRLKLAAPDQTDWSMGKLAVGVQKMALTQNVTRVANGDLYISGVPMVDQGAKGYCVAASCQRLFEYMQIPCDQHEMAQLLNVDAIRGTDPHEMQKSLAKVDSKFRVTFKPLVNPELFFDNKGKPRVSLKEFAAIVKEHTEKGTPLLWALQLGLFKEDPPLPAGGQVRGGHMRMIIGYNSKSNQILFTDSWGAGHELKRMSAADAYEATLGLYSMSPRGL